MPHRRAGKGVPVRLGHGHHAPQQRNGLLFGLVLPVRHAGPPDVPPPVRQRQPWQPASRGSAARTVPGDAGAVTGQAQHGTYTPDSPGTGAAPSCLRPGACHGGVSAMSCCALRSGPGLAARPGLLPDASCTLAGRPVSGPYRQVGQPCHRRSAMTGDRLIYRSCRRQGASVRPPVLQVRADGCTASAAGSDVSASGHAWPRILSAPLATQAVPVA